MRRIRINEKLLLGLVTAGATVMFAILYINTRIPIEVSGAGDGYASLEDWDIAASDANGAGLHEDKSIYEQDSNLYDVYISVFPTKDDSGEMIDFSAFGLHTARDHSYNPVLNCNIQILEEGQKPDPLLDLNQKNATIRVRGNSSRGDVYKSYKVKLGEEAGTFFGQKSLNINKHSEDICKISSKLQTDLLAQVDDSASYRTYFMRLWIRDTSLPEEEQEFRYYGLYTEIEQPNKTYLEARGLSSNAAMYKARDFSFASSDVLRDVDDPAYSEEAFETVLTIREGENHRKLLEMLEAVNDTARDFGEVFETYFDEENYLTWMAFQLLVGNDDILNHNFIIYSPENANTWYFIPWDFDETLRFGQHMDAPNRPDSLRSFQKLNMGILHQRFFRMTGSLEKLENKMVELLEHSVTREKVTALVDSYKTVLAKTMTLEPDLGLLEMSPNELIPYLDGLYDGILENYERFKKAVQSPAPMFVAQPVRLSDGSVEFSWEPSYSYQGLPLTYNLQLFEDVKMEKLLYEQKNIDRTEWVMEQKLAPGTYYLMVTVVDLEGHEQLSLEHVESPDIYNWYYMDGLLEFTIE